jgi:hypothetical protein
MFIAVVFTIAKLWKQPRCPSIDEWIKKMWYSDMKPHSYNQLVFDKGAKNI